MGRTAGRGGGGGSGIAAAATASACQPALALRPAAREALLRALTLLKHLLYAPADASGASAAAAAAAREACATAGLMEALGAVWPALRRDTALLHEALGVATNALCCCPAAARAAAAEPSGGGSGGVAGAAGGGGCGQAQAQAQAHSQSRSLLARITRLACAPAVDVATLRCALGPLRACAMCAEAHGPLLRGPLLQEATALLRRAAKQRDAPRQEALLQLLADVAASQARFPESVAAPDAPVSPGKDAGAPPPTPQAYGPQRAVGPQTPVAECSIGLTVGSRGMRLTRQGAR